MLLVVRKGTDEKYGKFAAVFAVDTIEEADKLTGAQPGEISWQLRRTGRWDSEDRAWAVFESEPPKDWE